MLREVAISILCDGISSRLRRCGMRRECVQCDTCFVVRRKSNHTSLCTNSAEQVISPVQDWMVPNSVYKRAGVM